jgi:phospholipid/cholesterol/gamma-HCH transport system substrate-binding protein
MLGDESYILYADFASVLGLHVSDPVMIADVRVGEVDSISLKDYQARVSMRIGHDVQVRQDAVASTESLGFALMGDKRVSIDPGTSAKPLRPGG